MRVSTFIVVALAMTVMMVSPASAACPKDFYGPEPACPCFQPSKLNETDSPLVLDLTRTKFINDTLHIYFFEALKYTGTAPVYHSPECAAAFTWHPTVVDGCNRVHHGEVPWSVAFKNSSFATSCGVTRQANQNGANAAANFITFTYDFAVQNQEALDPIRGTARTRTLIQRMPFQIVFPEEVTVTSGPIDVFAPVLVIAAVVRQEVLGAIPSTTPLSLGANIRTELQWPFKLTNPVLTAPSAVTPGTSTITNILPASSCDETNTGAICAQVWRFVTDANVGVCEFDGTYTLDFNVACRSGRAGNCPIDAATDDAQFVFTLDSSNHCPQVVDNLGLTADLRTFETAALNTLKADFIDTQIVHAASSVISSESSLLATSFSHVSIIATDANAVVTTFPLIENNAMRAAGTSLGFSKLPGAAAIAGQASVPSFRFTVDSDFLGAEEDDIIVIQLVAIVQIQYSNAGKNPAVDPAVLSAEGDQRVEVQANYGVQGTGVSAKFNLRSAAGSSSSSSSSSKVFGLSQIQAGGIIIGGVAFLALAVVGAVAVRYRRRERMIADALASRSSTSDVNLVVA